MRLSNVDEVFSHACNEINLEMKEVLHRVENDVEMICRKQSADHMLRSGNTIAKVNDALVAIQMEFAEIVLDRLSWAVANSIPRNREVLVRAKNLADFYMNQLSQAVYPKLRQIVVVAGEKAGVYEHSHKLLSGRLDTVKDRLGLSIEKNHLTFKVGVIKRIISCVFGALSKLASVFKSGG